MFDHVLLSWASGEVYCFSAMFNVPPEKKKKRKKSMPRLTPCFSTEVRRPAKNLPSISQQPFSIIPCIHKNNSFPFPHVSFDLFRTSSSWSCIHQTRRFGAPGSRLAAFPFRLLPCRGERPAEQGLFWEEWTVT